MANRLGGFLAAVAIALLLGSCGGGGDRERSDAGQEVEVVADRGVGSGIVHGLVVDMDVTDGHVALVGESAAGAPTLWRAEPHGSLSARRLPGSDLPSDVAVSSDGTPYVLTTAGIWRIGPAGPELVVASTGTSERATVRERGTIEAMTVDPEGRPIWTATVPDPVDPARPARILVRRLTGGTVELIAGSMRARLPADRVIYQQQRNPDSNPRAVGFPMLVPGPVYDVAADAEGTYLLGAGYVLKVDSRGGVSKILGASGRDVPTSPLASPRPAPEHGFEVGDSGGVSADGGNVVVLDLSLAGEVDPEGAFDWTGRFTPGQQQVVDQVVGADDGSRDFDGVALLVHDSAATTALAHVSATAVDSGRLYGVGQVGDLQNPMRLRAIVVATSLPY